MLEASRRRRTVVFDLDDTLYDEADYVRSGKLAIAELVSRLYGTDITEILLNEPGDFLEAACRAINLPPDAKTTLLWTYRLHRPQIVPRSGVHDLWARLRRRGDAICILTDGRAITQRLKVEALGMAPDGLYISEDIGAEKPSPVGFQLVEREFPANEYIYVADNPKKDFIAPIQIGWRTFGLTPRASSVHRSSWSTAAQLVQPETWVDDFEELAARLEVPPVTDATRVP